MSTVRVVGEHRYGRFIELTGLEPNGAVYVRCTELASAARIVSQAVIVAETELVPRKEFTVITTCGGCEHNVVEKPEEILEALGIYG